MKSDKSKTIYIFTDWYTPAYKAGGPIQSVYNLASLLSKSFKVRIVTRISDYGSNEPFEGVIPNQWNTLGSGHEVMYLSSHEVNYGNIRKICFSAKNDTILINGIFSFYFSILPLFFSGYYNTHKIFVAVRGMLHQSALAIKPLKKQIFLAFARGFGLYKKTTLLSTSEYENEEIKKCLGNTPVAYAPNIPVQPIDVSQIENKKFKDENGCLRVLFIGRISPEKNPLGLVKALGLIDYRITVLFVGSSIDGSYQMSFENELMKLSERVKYEWVKELPHHEIQKLFDRFDLMVLPSFGENFGHAIFESFANGTPVVIGNNTPWKNIESQKAGFEVNPENAGELAAVITRFYDMSAAEFKIWQSGALETANNYFNRNNFEKLYLTLFS